MRVCAQFELYSSRVAEFEVYGRQNHPRADGPDYARGLNSTAWQLLGRYTTANTKGTQVTIRLIDVLVAALIPYRSLAAYARFSVPAQSVPLLQCMLLHRMPLKKLRQGSRNHDDGVPESRAEPVFCQPAETVSNASGIRWDHALG